MLQANLKKMTGLKDLQVFKEKQSVLGSPFCKLLINLIKFETNEAKETVRCSKMQLLLRFYELPW